MSLISYLQNEDLCSIGAKLAAHIAADQELDRYCDMHFGKNLTIIVGPPEAYMPQDINAPYLFIHDFGKAEGAAINTASYECVFSLGLDVDEENAELQPDVIVYAGQQRTSEMLTLLQDALYRYKGGCQPPTAVEQLMPGLPGNNSRHWEGFLTAVWTLDISIGGQNHF